MKALYRALLVIVVVPCIFSCAEVRASWFSDLFKDVSHEMPVVTQDDNNVIVTMNIPEDIDPDDIHVEIEEKTLYVYGKKENKQEIKKEGYFHSEVSSSSFNRAASLPCLVEEDMTTAEISDDVLTVTMPKIKAELQMTKKIKVMRAK